MTADMPTELTTTLRLDWCELSSISLRMANIWTTNALLADARCAGRKTNVLVARVGKDDDGKCAESFDRARPLDGPDTAPVVGRVSDEKVGHHQDDQVADRHQGNKGRVLERVQPAKETQRDQHEPARPSESAPRGKGAARHEPGNPEMAVQQKLKSVQVQIKALDNLRHQVPDDDEIRYRHS